MADETVGEHVKTPSPWFTNRVYNILKFVAQILLPALGTLYAAVAGLWGLPATEEVVGTVVAVDTFLGVVLGISSAQYLAAKAVEPTPEPEYDGVMAVSSPDEMGLRSFQLELANHPEHLAAKDQVSFKVVNQGDAVPGDLPPVPPVG